MTVKVERRLAAIVSSDVAGYSRLMGADEEGTLKALKSHRKDLIDPTLAKHGGRIVKTTGDGMLIEFPSIVDAVRSCAEIQSAMAERNRGISPDRRILFRVGINIGDIIIDEGDIYGDGVNVAARLQEIAEPGMIAISGQARDALTANFGLEIEELGPRNFKNIARSVQVFAVHPPGVASAPPSAPVAGSLRRKSALAVLPFSVFGTDPEAEALAEGLVEDILTGLARFRLVSVIARNSTFEYKGRSVDVKQAARELGANYVLEGSVRRVGGRVRITGQLIDAASGAHLWAERYDRNVEDVFAVQDEVAQAVVAGVELPLVSAENRRGAADPTGAGADPIKAAGWLLFRFDRESNDRAIALLEAAVRENPHADRRHEALAMGLAWRMAFGWTDTPDATAERALAVIEAAVRLNDQDAMHHAVLGWCAVYAGQYDRGIAALVRSIEINPNSGVNYGVNAWVLGHVGDPRLAIASFTHTLRLAPQHPFLFMHATGTAWAHFALDQLDEALKHAETAMMRRPNCFAPRIAATAILGVQGAMSEAREAMREVHRLVPRFSLEWLSGFLHLRSPAVRERAMAGLRAAGAN